MNHLAVAPDVASAETSSDELPLVITLPGRYDASCSILGRLARRVHADRRVAEGMFYFYLFLLVAGGAIAVQWTGILLTDSMGVTPVVILQALIVALVVVIGFIGWRPRFRLEVGDERLELHQGVEALTADLDEIGACCLTSAVEVHRHWSRYSETALFAYRPTDDAMVLRLKDGTPIVISLPEPDLSLVYERMASLVTHPETV